MSSGDMHRETHGVPQDFKDYSEAWAGMMVRIWQDRIKMLRAFDTGALHGSVSASPPGVAGLSASFQFRFLLYGTYVDCGVGPEFARSGRDAQGRLPILDDLYRVEAGLDEPRKRGPKWGGGYTSGQARAAKPWFNRSWSISRRVMAEKAKDFAGEAFLEIFDGLTDGKNG